MRRALLLAPLLAVLLIALAWPDAHAAGSDPFGPEHAGLMDRYPLNAYSLDTHINSSALPGNSWGEEAAGFVTNVLWTGTALVVKLLIGLVSLAFSLDLLGKGGALQPIAEAIRTVHEHVIGDPFMVAAIGFAGLWAIKKAIIERRHAEAASSLALSGAFVIICLFLIFQPVQTVGQVAHWTNQVSTALLTGTNEGSIADPEQAKRRIADELFATQILAPWAVLNFGVDVKGGDAGLRHCVDGTSRDKDGYPEAVAVDSPRRTACRDHLRQVNGMGGYAARFLAQKPGSDARGLEFEAIRDGEVPFNPLSGSQFDGYHVDKSDTPAVDIQRKGGAYMRLGYAVAIAVVSVGFVAVFGVLAFAIVLAQIAALLILAFAPVVLLAAMIPGRGHDLFRSWGGKLATALVIKVFYSLVISVLIAVSAALVAATATLGWLYAFGLLGAFYWMVFAKRKWMAEQVGSRREYTRSENRVRDTANKTVSAGAGMVVAPFATLAGLAKGKQESALDNARNDYVHGRIEADEFEERVGATLERGERQESAHGGGGVADGQPREQAASEGPGGFDSPAAPPVPSVPPAHNDDVAVPPLRGHGPASPAVAAAPPERTPSRPPVPLDDPELQPVEPSREFDPPVVHGQPRARQEAAPSVPDLAPPPEYRGPR